MDHILSVGEFKNEIFRNNMMERKKIYLQLFDKRKILLEKERLEKERLEKEKERLELDNKIVELTNNLKKKEELIELFKNSRNEYEDDE